MTNSTWLLVGGALGLLWLNSRRSPDPEAPPPVVGSAPPASPLPPSALLAPTVGPAPASPVEGSACTTPSGLPGTWRSMPTQDGSSTRLVCWRPDMVTAFV